MKHTKKKLIDDIIEKNVSLQREGCQKNLMTYFPVLAHADTQRNIY